MSTYRHTQFGTVNVVIIIAILPLVFLPAWLAGAAPLAWMILIFLLGILVLFYNLTVTIDAEHLRISFGIGVIRKRFPLDQIDSCQPVRNSWLYGWGIRLTPRGWLYNVSGLKAVELKMKSGKTCRIGTDEPEVLAAALREALSRLGGSSKASE
ncbi:MAG: hypothetical protein OXG98_14965 [Gemmatimonadetes bacterium]|nr:hypothetical protein [Gemmatimonadota bacterium]